MKNPPCFLWGCSRHTRPRLQRSRHLPRHSLEESGGLEQVPPLVRELSQNLGRTVALTLVAGRPEQLVDPRGDRDGERAGVGDHSLGWPAIERESLECGMRAEEHRTSMLGDRG